MPPHIASQMLKGYYDSAGRWKRRRVLKMGRTRFMPAAGPVVGGGTEPEETAISTTADRPVRPRRIHLVRVRRSG